MKVLTDFEERYRSNADISKEKTCSGANVYRARMSIQADLPERDVWRRMEHYPRRQPQQKISPLRKLARCIAKNVKKFWRRIVYRGEIRIRAAKVIWLVLCVMLGLFLLTDAAGIMDCENHIQTLNQQIKTISDKNETMAGQIETKISNINVCTEAVHLNLISSGGIKQIQLTVDENACFDRDRLVASK